MINYLLFLFMLQPTQQEIQDYVKTFEGKMSAFLQDVKPLSDEELQKLGIKVNIFYYRFSTKNT